MNTNVYLYLFFVVLFCSTSALIVVAIMDYVEPHDFYIYVIIALILVNAFVLRAWIDLNV